MIRLILLEDEPAALRRLQRMIAEIRPEWTIAGTADSVADGLPLVRDTSYDLILTDIHLSDGLFFEISSAIPVTKPVIFITAYDEYAIRAFSLNSIHYLVKPLEFDKLNDAFNKFEKHQILVQPFLSELLAEPEKLHSPKLLSRIGNRTVVINTSDVAMIYTAQRSTMAVLFSGKEHLLDQSLDTLLENLPENQFFRINRQWIIQRKAVKAYKAHTSYRLLLETDPVYPEEIVVSKERTPLFRSWFGV